MAAPRERLPPGLTALLVALVLLRVLYHCTYLAEVPFALATFSDGRQYENAARDLLAHPPWGTEPFYLQGLYAYQMALPMLIRAWVSFALLFQLLLTGLTHAWFFRSVARWRGRREAAWATVTLLSCPMLAFYENKFLTASLAVTASVAVLAAAVWVHERSSAGRWAALGAAVGVAILARPNFALLAPILAAGCWHATRRWPNLAALVVGMLLVLAPMAARNAVVTGRVTVFPAHGGGTSFYIGNNAQARGVWNDGGGLLSGDVSRERQELRETLGVEAGTDAADEIAAIGRALYARGLDEIAGDPGGWLWLEVRKLWLLIGNDALTQDYDLHGERELLWCAPRWGLPFGVVLALGLLGVGRMRGCGLVGWAVAALICSTVAANLLYFTSAQHRLPLLVPLALLVPDGVRTLREAVAQRRIVTLGVFVVLLGSSMWPRTHKDAPSAVHYYNLSVAWLYVSQPREAIAALDRAVEIRPDHPVIRIERATLLRERGKFQRAADDLDALDALPEVPSWIRARMHDERRRLHTWGLPGPGPSGEAAPR